VEPIIELKNADIYQRERLVLNNVNLSINKGEFLYIIGKVGSGKSSLLKTFYNELPLIAGTGVVCGYHLEKIRPIFPTFAAGWGLFFRTSSSLPTVLSIKILNLF